MVCLVASVDLSVKALTAEPFELYYIGHTIHSVDTTPLVQYQRAQPTDRGMILMIIA